MNPPISKLGYDRGNRRVNPKGNEDIDQNKLINSLPVEYLFDHTKTSPLLNVR